MEAEKVKSELKKAIEKYGLPEFEILDKELEIVDMLAERRELPQNMLCVIRRRFTEAVYSWINFIHSLIVPNPQSIIVNKDAEAFDDKEKERIYRTMAVLAKMTRESTGFEANRKQDKKEAKFIKENFEKYLEIKKDILALNQKIIEHWQKEIDSNS